MGELGTRLREAREGKGITLEQAEQTTRIRRAFLEALEAERFDELPGDVYARGFIRNYAHYLGLNADEMLAAYKKATGKPVMPAIRQVLDEPLAHRPSGGAWSGVLWALIIVALVALGGWYLYTRFAPEVSNLLSTLGLSAQATATPTRPALPTITQTVVTEEATRTAIATATASAPAEPSPTASPTRELVTETATATPTITLTPTMISGIHIEATITALTYLSVTVDGQIAFEGLLDKGVSKTWNAQRIIAMRVGNAGGVELVVNGVKVGVVGKDGQVLDVQYTKENLPH